VRPVVEALVTRPKVTAYTLGECDIHAVVGPSSTDLTGDFEGTVCQIPILSTELLLTSAHGAKHKALALVHREHD
jgi:hypothetical protein